MKPPLRFRRARPDEAALLSAIARAAKQHWGYSDEWMAAWQDELTVTAEYIRSQPVHVVERDGAVVGFLGLRPSADGWQLEHLWLRPEHHGCGLGRALFAEAVAQAKAAGGRELKIKSDPNAETFYLKMGAVRTGLESYLLPGRTRRDVPLLVHQVR